MAAGPYATKALLQALEAQVNATTQVLGYNTASKRADGSYTYYGLSLSSTYAADVFVGVQFESAGVAALALSKLQQLQVADPGTQEVLAVYPAAQVLRLGRRLIVPPVRPPPQAVSMEVTLRFPGGVDLPQWNGMQAMSGFGLYGSTTGVDSVYSPANVDVSLLQVPFRLRPGQFLPTPYLPGPQPAPLALEVVDNGYLDAAPVLRYRTSEGKLYSWPAPTLVEDEGVGGGAGGGGSSAS
ncbi:hypothetical protein [Deinococcus sp. Leaf326]|uniref:hypothetical protein n=1 Tax=Deinococcus sp. Leaf326 TaxID=1736338 RepID=UPI0006F1C909|nr:hypothetical protein [Deinococcus sp. Leaf326]KQR40736.1 hypothetical protein ASF71_00785 [Deinococcus sp. Leaf326]